MLMLAENAHEKGLVRRSLMIERFVDEGLRPSRSEWARSGLDPRRELGKVAEKSLKELQALSFPHGSFDGGDTFGIIRGAMDGISKQRDYPRWEGDSAYERLSVIMPEDRLEEIAEIGKINGMELNGALGVLIFYSLYKDSTLTQLVRLGNRLAGLEARPE